MRAPSSLSPLLFVVSGLSCSLLACGKVPEQARVSTPSSAPAVVDEDEDALAPAAASEPRGAIMTAEVPFPAPHPSMPQIPRHGGTVLHDPRIVTVTFPDDALAEKIQAFDDQVGQLAWWGTVAQSYGFGPAQGGGHVAVADAPPQAMTDADVEQWLSARIADGTLPAPTDQTLYALYYPATTTISFRDIEGGGGSCQMFLGYHTAVEVTVAGQQIPVAYAVVNRCGGLDQVTETASHELAEAASDPHPLDSARAGFVFLEDNAWTVLGGENADMCAGVRGVTEAGWALTRVWSNDAAAIGNQPCVPAPPGGEPYFNAGVVHESLVVAPGATASTEVDCYSFGPLSAPMTLSAEANGGSGMRFAFDRKTCKNGDKVTMTVTAPATTKRGTDDHYTLLANLNGTSHLWRGVIQVR